ncbi:helix-turn-helix domain-containing protein [Amycolatopsis cihanbeyliensis]|uniref:Helix-turn-helix protein n=1 Tax=Amycolatopsis cihanbeyliensis TaxID=1128664 RepID=A0A542DRY4_AMYCI|nr:helix-turn-helix transcriptional regulator [Amycolatopsis cihanbeyliensis]TQJ05877.1 helix-turn-helix protein [Amycolatopsis cihanbeyliensis]
MTRAHSPLGSQRRLLAALREARDALKLTQKDVAEALEWSVSKLIRIENGSVGLSITDLKALLLHYGITDRDRVESYVELARESKQPAWWDQYRRTSPPEFVKFLGLEASAIRIRQFQFRLVPGLLQVPAYTRSLVLDWSGDSEKAERGVVMRQTRQQRLADKELDHYFILDESVLYRRVTEPDGWREQLDHLRAVAGQPNVHIQILPFKVGVVPGMQSSFAILELSDQVNDYALSLEQPDHDVLFDDSASAEKIADYVKLFFGLEKAALPAEETPRMIDRALARLEEE